MKYFQVVPEIHRCADMKEFHEAFNINERDLVFTHEFIYEPAIKPLGIKANYVFQEKFGMGEPTDEMIDQIFEATKDIDYDRVIAVGGGSVVDIAKLLTLKDRKSSLAFFERKVPLIKEKKLIIVPTTCGTGSEVTNISIMGIVSRETKMGLADNIICADITCLIPELVKTLPFKFFVFSSVDALIHAIEGFVSPKSNPYTEMFSIKAIELIMAAYKKIIANGPESRMDVIEDVLMASNFAGIAFGNAGVGAVHALSYPLGGKYHVAHGEANYQFFTEVFKVYNAKNPNGKIKQANEIIATNLGCTDMAKLYDELDAFLGKLLPKRPLKEYHVEQADVDAFPDLVIATQQRLLGNNYVPLSKEEIHQIYKNLF